MVDSKNSKPKKWLQIHNKVGVDIKIFVVNGKIVVQCPDDDLRKLLAGLTDNIQERGGFPITECVEEKISEGILIKQVEAGIIPPSDPDFLEYFFFNTALVYEMLLDKRFEDYGIDLAKSEIRTR